VAARGRRNADAVLAAALAGGAKVKQAAQRADVSERTAFRRLADPGFRRQVVEARSAMVARACGRMAAGMAGAAVTLRRLLKAESDAVKLGAARALLELGYKLGEVAGIREQLDELRRELEALGRHDGGAEAAGGEAEGGGPPPGPGGGPPAPPASPGERQGPGVLPDGPGHLCG
jgi:hypothetical protein